MHSCANLLILTSKIILGPAGRARSARPISTNMYFICRCNSCHWKNCPSQVQIIQVLTPHFWQLLSKFTRQATTSPV